MCACTLITHLAEHLYSRLPQLLRIRPSKRIWRTLLKFFERSSQEATYYNPAKFCLPFYRSFLAVTFQEAGSQEQVNRYLAEAKGAVAGSKSRRLLLRGSREPLPSAARGPPGQRTPGVASRPGGLSTILRTCGRAAGRNGRYSSGSQQAPPPRSAHHQPANKSDS